MDDLGDALTPLSADVMVTYSIPYEYDQTAGCTTFDAYLEKVCPDADTRETLLRMMAPTSIIMESRESTYGGVVAPVGRGCRPVFRRSARPFYNICVQINVL